jgi:hypothetical protein
MPGVKEHRLLKGFALLRNYALSRYKDKEGKSKVQHLDYD